MSHGSHRTKTILLGIAGGLLMFAMDLFLVLPYAALAFGIAWLIAMETRASHRPAPVPVRARRTTRGGSRRRISDTGNSHPRT